MKGVLIARVTYYDGEEKKFRCSRVVKGDYQDLLVYTNGIDLISDEDKEWVTLDITKVKKIEIKADDNAAGNIANPKRSPANHK